MYVTLLPKSLPCATLRPQLELMQLMRRVSPLHAVHFFAWYLCTTTKPIRVLCGSMQVSENPNWADTTEDMWPGPDHSARASSTYRGAQRVWARRQSSSPSASSRPICRDAKKGPYTVSLSGLSAHPATPAVLLRQPEQQLRLFRFRCLEYKGMSSQQAPTCNISTPSKPLLFCLPCGEQRKHWAA